MDYWKEQNPQAYDDIILSFDPLFRLMRKQGVTDLQLARQIGVKVDLIRNIQLRQDVVTVQMLKKICKALDCGPGDIMDVSKVLVIPATQKGPDD